MAASPPVTALPWYARGDYPALLQLFSDSDLLPATYDGWLKRAELVERQFQKAGFGVAKIRIRPAPFAAWCKDGTFLPIRRRAWLSQMSLRETFLPGTNIPAFMLQLCVTAD